jgi:hypothetical protein
MQPSASKYTTTNIREILRIVVEEILSHKQTASAIVDITMILLLL